MSASRVAKWDGNNWSALGSGTSGAVLGLAADGSGHLFVGGDFSYAGTNVSPFIAQANIGGAFSGRVLQCVALSDGTVALNCIGVAGKTYVLQRATDLRFTGNLTTLLTTNAPSPDGVFRCADANPPAQSAFYRLVPR